MSALGRKRPSSSSAFSIMTRLLLLLLLLSVCYASRPSSKTVPLNKWKQLSSIKENQQFIYKHVNNKPSQGVNLSPNEKIIYQNDTLEGFDRTGVGILAGTVAEPGGCEPQERAVSIPLSDDPRIIYWPPCTRLAQCGGCCGTEMLECMPTKTEEKIVQVMKVIYSESSSSDFEYQGLQDVSLTRHLECDCRCRTQAHHCDPQIQDYNEHSCSCRCRNEHLATSCPTPKRWDEKVCACVCPKVLHCLGDEYFSFAICGCLRGVPEGSTTLSQLGTEGAVTSDPCASVSCRAGYRAVLTGTSCLCRLQSRSVRVRSRSVGAHRQASSRIYHFDDLFN